MPEVGPNGAENKKKESGAPATDNQLFPINWSFWRENENKNPTWHALMTLRRRRRRSNGIYPQRQHHCTKKGGGVIYILGANARG